jgi:integrase
MKPGTSRREVADGGSPGLYLVVQPTGVMSWALRCRVGGKSAKVTLGTVNVEAPANAEPRLGGYLTLGEARVIAAQQRHLLAQGIDPRDAKIDAMAKADAAADAAEKEIVSAVVADFLAKHARAKKRRSAGEVDRLFRKHVLPYWGKRQIASITRKDIVARLDELAVETPIQANRVLAAIRKMMNWAVSRDIIPASPAAGVPTPSAENARDRVLYDTEIAAFWEAAGSLGYPFGPAFRLMLATAQRRDEVGGMRFVEIDAERGIWTVPRDRAKNDKPNVVPLPPLAADILKGVTRIDSKAGFVFTTTGRTAISGWTKGKDRLDAAMRDILVRDGILAEGEELPEFTLHDLRRTAATIMARLAVPVHVVEAVLNHKSGKVSGIAAVYNKHDYLAEKRAALELLAAEIQKITKVMS